MQHTTRSAYFVMGLMGFTATSGAQELSCGTHVLHPARYGPVVEVPASVRSGAGEKVIPMVFHVLYDGGSGNISDAQILDAVSAVNEAFNMTDGDTLAVYPGDTVVTADVEVRFCLATRGPDGQATSGIERISTPLTNDGLNPAAKLNPWPRERYLNIWVVNAAGNTSGYTLLPAEADDQPLLDGIVILHDYLGGIGSSSGFLRHTLTHEVGHFLDLLHPWDIPTGFGTCGDDLVDDTPITSPGIYCPTDVSVCAPPTIEYLPNFMNLYACQQMFTAGQRVRMRATLEGSIAQRNNLWTEENLTATGACSPTAVNERPRAQAMTAAPNPFTDRTRLSGCTPGKAVVQVMDARGSMVMQRDVVVGPTGTLELDLSPITSPGLHLVRLTDGGGGHLVPLLKE